MAKFNFNLRSPGLLTVSPIYLIIRYNNQKLVYPTDERIEPRFWNKDEQRAISTKRFPEGPYLNERLDTLVLGAKNTFRKFQLDNENREPSIQELRHELNLHYKKILPVESFDLFSFIQKFISEADSRVNDRTGKPLSKSTIQIYKNTKSLLTDYRDTRSKYLNFESIDLDFYYDFVEYLTKEKKFSNNTIGKTIRTVKVFLNDATERGYNKSLAYKSKKFKVVSEEVEKIYLNESELAAIFKLKLGDNKRLEKVRDLFLVGCWTGLRFSDLSTLDERNIQDEFIEVKTQKTGEKVLIPIHPVVGSILKKYKGVTHNSLPPVISNAKMNSYLKEIMEMEDSLKKKIPLRRTKQGKELRTMHRKCDLVTVHTARRSFATNLYLSDFPTLSIMKITGHVTEASFLEYIKVTPRESADKLKAHWEKQFG